MEDFIGRTDAATRTAKDAVCVAICDDEAFMLDLLEEKVKKMLPSGATKRFSSGRELLEDSTKVDILLLDIQMPEMDGIAALKSIKSSDPGATVIMCSAMGQQAMVIESIQAGAKDFIVKPFQPDRVIEAVKKVVG